MARAERAFAAAASAAGQVVVRSYAIAGLSVTLRFAGAALVERLSPALEHHPPAPAGTTALTVLVWDSRSTGIPLPPCPPDAIDGGTSGRARVAAWPTIRAKYRPDLRILSLLDRGRNLAVFCVADGAAIPYWETGAPLRLILHWWMADHGRLLIHAAAVGTASGGVLLVGRGGCGKSSTALACLGSALRYAGDDYCLVTLEGTPRAHTLYSSGKLSADQVRRFPHLAPAILNRDALATEKALVLVHRSHPHSIQPSFPIRALVAPVIAPGGASRLAPASRGTALRALAPSTILQLPGAGGTALATMTRLVRRVPSYRLHLGHDLEALPSLLARAATAPEAV